MTRNERYAAFKKMLTSAHNDIKNIEKNFGSDFFRKVYTFYITPRGRYGGDNETIFEYFYGNRPYEGIQYIRKNNIIRKLCRESGATMLYHRHDDGYVSCQLFPAQSENMSQIEDSIFLHMHISPEKLTKKLLEKHFKCFLSYMKVTSLDGNPGWYDKFIVIFIRLKNHTIVNGKHHPPKMNQYIYEIIKFSLTVGLSGFILFIIQWLFK